MDTQGLIPQRVITGFMGFLAVMVGYTMRACLSVAITEMVVPLTISTDNNESLICSIDQTDIGESHHTQDVREPFDIFIVKLFEVFQFSF